MDHLRERNGAGRLRFVDISAPDFEPAAWGTTLEALNAELHGVRPDGHVLRGMEVLRLAYAAVGLGWVMQATALGPLRPLFDRAYRAFARHRQPISRAAAPLIDALRAHRARRVGARMARCSAGSCGVEPAAKPGRMEGMKVLVCGAGGCVGSSVVRTLRSRGHEVVEATRSATEGPRSTALDFMAQCPPQRWAERLRAHEIEAIVNCVGILMPSRTQSFERVHAAGPIELFRGAAAAGVRRIVQISALGVGADAACIDSPYLHSKLLADEALAALPLAWAVLRPSLIFGPRSQSAELFATLASLPVVSLPGGGDQALQPIHVFEVAEAAARWLEADAPASGVHELGGAEVLSYRAMLERYRAALGLGDALWLPVPMPLMKLGAWLAEALPQKVFCRDMVRLLERGNATASNATPGLLGRAPTTLTQGLAITPPLAALDLRVELSPAVAWMLRGSLAFMWIYTAAISALLRDESGVMRLLAHCGLEGSAGTAALAFSCTLNLTLDLLLMRRLSAPLYATQCMAIVGYTVAAAIHMPS